MEGIFHDVFACFFQFVWFIFNGCYFSPLGLHVFLHVSDVIDCMFFYHMNYCFVLHFFA